MLYIVIFFLLVSVYLYCLLGGGDFGAGILELTASKRTEKRVRNLVTDAIAPIWEANHIWLIITVVILFNGFPAVYTTISTALYIPLIFLLLGIVFRGTAFTFRHYDAVKDKSQDIFSLIFSYSSLAVILFFGLVIGAIVSNKIMLHPYNFYQGYIYPWFNLFSFAVGLFLCSLFSFIASVYLITGMADEDTRKEYLRKTKMTNLTAVITGILVFITSYTENVGFTEKFFTNTASIILIIASAAVIPLLWRFLDQNKKWPARITAGAELLFILGAFYAVYFPVIVVLKDADDLTLFNSASPEITLDYLGGALIAGSLLIFPALFYLYRVFKAGNEERLT